MKRFFLIVVSALSIFCLTACAVTINRDSGVEQESDSKQSILVYDSDGEKVLETEDQVIIDKFSDYASQESVEGLEIFDDLPQDAQLAYRFILKDQQSKYEITMQVYENYDYLSIQDLPILGDIKLKLPEKEADWFRNPQNW